MEIQVLVEKVRSDWEQIFIGKRCEKYLFQ